MNLNSVHEDHQNFENNIKKEPEAEFLCILPSYESGITHKVELVRVKRENEIRSKEIPKFQCKTCQKFFGSNYILSQHEKTHQKQQCKVCYRKLPPKSLEKHMKRHQNEKSERKFECKMCFRKLLTKSQLSCHALSHLKRFQCDLCGYLSAYKRNVMVHMNLHLAQDQYRCLVCGKLFKDRESFRFHSWQDHKELKNRKRLTKADFSCGTCGKEFDDVQQRKQHEISHKEKVQCKICDQKCKPSYLAQHLKSHELKKKGIKFICDICGYEYAHKSNLKCHLENHFNPEIAECKICCKTFTNTKLLKSHSKRTHNLNVEPSELCCNICHVKFPNLSALTNHKFIHKAPKICPICSKSLKVRYFLSHTKLHELKKEEKKFECKVCKKQFYTDKNLRLHTKTHLKSAFIQSNLKKKLARHIETRSNSK